MPASAALRRLAAWLGRYAYLGVAAGALLLVTRTVDFSPPETVREVALPLESPPPPVDEAALPAELRAELGAEGAVQLRATLRLAGAQSERGDGDDGDHGDGEHGDGDQGGDDLGDARILSQPVVATLPGVPAAIHQTVRVDGGALELRIDLEATPRLRPGRGREPGEYTLATTLEIHTRRRDDGGPRRLHLRSEATLGEIVRTPHRLLFTIDDHLFALDLELFPGAN